MVNQDTVKYGKDDNNDWIILDEEFANESDIDNLLLLLQEDGIDVENDVMLHHLLEDRERICLRRQLGSWIEVYIDGDRKRVTCNCEDYNCHYSCLHQALFEVIQFGKLPNSDCSFTVEDWNQIHKTCVKFMKDTYLYDESMTTRGKQLIVQSYF